MDAGCVRPATAELNSLPCCFGCAVTGLVYHADRILRLASCLSCQTCYTSHCSFTFHSLGHSSSQDKEDWRQCSEWHGSPQNSPEGKAVRGGQAQRFQAGHWIDSGHSTWTSSQGPETFRRFLQNYPPTTTRRKQGLETSDCRAEGWVQREIKWQFREAAPEKSVCGPGFAQEAEERSCRRHPWDASASSFGSFCSQTGKDFKSASDAWKKMSKEEKMQFHAASKAPVKESDESNSDSRSPQGFHFF